MGLRTADDGESRFAGYVEGLVSVIGHTDRAGPLRDYCVGLMLPCERKSVEPMAAVTAPAQVAAKHQSLLHCVPCQGALMSWVQIPPGNSRSSRKPSERIRRRRMV